MRLVTQFILDYVKYLLNIVEIVLTSQRVGTSRARVRYRACARAVGESKREGRAQASILYLIKKTNYLFSVSEWVHLDGGTCCVSLHPNTLHYGKVTTLPYCA